MKSLTIAALFSCLVMFGCTAAENKTDEKKSEGGTKMKEIRSGDWSPGLTDDEKETLFSIVDDTLVWCVNEPNKPFSFDKYTITDKMKTNTATFVTLKIQGRLRGCIGSLSPVDPMYKSVHENAVLASLRDHRFRPVSSSELKLLDVHISLLSPITSIPSVDEFKVGEHGIIVEKGMRRAVYLPEVAVEQKWTKEETLSSLSMKAGMSADSWKRGAKFKVFSSVVLSKKDEHL